MVALKVRKVGNSLGFSAPQEVWTTLRATEGDTVFFTASPDGFRLTPYDPEFERQMTVAREIMKEDRDLLRELAKR